MIPDEAVEAAYRASGAGCHSGYITRQDVRAILQAAAPHLMAVALREAGEGAPNLEANRYLFARAEAVEQEPEPCEYCSIAANALKVHDGSCDGMTEQEWRALRGEGDTNV